MKAKYFIEGSEASYSDCLEHFVLHSGFARSDAEQVFRENDNPESCEYLTQECSEIEIIYE